MQLDSILEGLIPRAFAVVKETARRFKENKQLVVTATTHDHFIAAQRKGVTIEGEKAIWLNQWIAAGNEVTWDMLHYDVQLIGGVVLFQGKIAEMATGEGKTLVATLPAYLRAWQEMEYTSLPSMTIWQKGTPSGWDLFLSFMA